MRSLIRSGLDKYFYLGMSLLITAIAAFGFGRNIGRRFLHPESPPPFIMYPHVAIFTGWLLIMIMQSSLVRTKNLIWHKRLGMAGAVLGISLPIIGIATAIIMHNWRHHGEASNPSFFAVSLNDMLSFSVAFGLAIYWRKKPEFHRRLMLIATASLTVAAFARFPPGLMVRLWWYAYVDVLIVLGMVRDLVVIGKVHAAYLYGLPLLMASQVLAMYLFLAAPAWWVDLLHLFLN